MPFLPPLTGTNPLRSVAPWFLIVLVGAACYSDSLSGEFVFDDPDSIIHNETIRRLDSWSVLSPPPAQTVSGRPLLNLSLALNYAVGREDVFGYHLVNIVLHLLTALILFALIRGTLRLPSIPDRFRFSATGIALAVALLWVAHPLQTEAVTYVIQRGEILATLFYLLTLRSVLLAAELNERASRWQGVARRHPRFRSKEFRARRRARAWEVLAVASCTLGALSKEIIASAPVLALLYDRTFLAGSFREALRRRGLMYAGLFSTWLLLGGLIYSAHGRGGTVGFDTGVSPAHYAATQSLWILHYLHLSVWPGPLVFDYGSGLEPLGLPSLLASGFILLGLFVTVIEVVDRSPLGVVLFAFFAILAPTSSFIPIASQVANEHRMYLPLVAPIILAVFGFLWLLARVPLPGCGRLVLSVVVLAVCTTALGIRTYLRNQDYRTGLSLWADTVAKAPLNVRARVCYGFLLAEHGRGAEALAELRTAVQLAPEYDKAWESLGRALLEQNQPAAATAAFRKWVEFDPKNPLAAATLAATLEVDHQIPESAAWYTQAAELDPGNAEVQWRLARVLASQGRRDEAEACLRRALQLDPRLARRLVP